MSSRKTYHWQCRDRTLKLGERTLVMGILNVTPDSFSDGGDFSNPETAVERALEMVDQGADIIDIGGESTRPGADRICATDEINRTVPIIETIRKHSDIPISIDTTKSEVALQAMEAGADIINDISAFETDSSMAAVAAQTNAGVILMHMKGSPKSMQDSPGYGDVVSEVHGYLRSRAEFATNHGIGRNHIVLDPGIGFGKTVEHNLELLRHLPALAACGSPILVGASRKSFIGRILEKENPSERLVGSLGIAAWSVVQGTHILRVHDVIDTCDICRLMDTLLVGEF